jgi:hypothetical protein
MKKNNKAKKSETCRHQRQKLIRDTGPVEEKNKYRTKATTDDGRRTLGEVKEIRSTGDQQNNKRTQRQKRKDGNATNNGIRRGPATHNRFVHKVDAQFEARPRR